MATIPGKGRDEVPAISSVMVNGLLAYANWMDFKWYLMTLWAANITCKQKWKCCIRLLLQQQNIVAIKFIFINSGPFWCDRAAQQIASKRAFMEQKYPPSRPKSASISALFLHKWRLNGCWKSFYCNARPAHEAPQPSNIRARTVTKSSPPSRNGASTLKLWDRGPFSNDHLFTSLDCIYFFTLKPVRNQIRLYSTTRGGRVIWIQYRSKERNDY